MKLSCMGLLMVLLILLLLCFVLPCCHFPLIFLLLPPTYFSISSCEVFPLRGKVDKKMCVHEFRYLADERVIFLIAKMRLLISYNSSRTGSCSSPDRLYVLAAIPVQLANVSNLIEPIGSQGAATVV